MIKLNEIPNYFIDILSSIYNDVYNNILKSEFVIFLCGAQSSKELTTKRDKLRKIFDSDKNKFKNLKVMYAEELFRTIVHKRSADNFLELENILGDSADKIIIFLESPGAFVELGAFSNDNRLCSKLIVINNEEFKGKSSFIELGPLKKLKKANSNSVIYMNDIDVNLAKNIYNQIKNDNINKDEGLESLVALINFIQIYLYFVSPVTFDEIIEHINIITKELITDLNIRVKSVINYLMTSEKIVKKVKKTEKEFYLLNDEGYIQISNMLKRYDINSLKGNNVDKLRMASMYYKLKHDKDNYRIYAY